MLKTDIIENYRIKHDLTKTELASKLKMLPSNYTMMMDSKSTSLKTIYKIARLFKISAKKLIED
jgi:DNA-binding XRE family transcriptional regulator